MYEIHRIVVDHGYRYGVTDEPLDDESFPTPAFPAAEIVWLSTGAAAKRLGVTVRTLYRFIDEAQVPAYKMGRVIRLQRGEVDEFIRRSRVPAGSLEHLYPEARKEASEIDDNSM